MNISLFCPENNINDNPSIHGIIRILCEQGHNLNIVVGRRAGPQGEANLKFNQITPHPKVTLHFVDGSFFYSGYLTEAAPFEMSRADLNIGVDADGVIVGAYFSKQYDIPLGMISYEIFFSDEINSFEKEKEIAACRDISFAIVSDTYRGNLLCLENNIPREKLIYIPVAGRHSVRNERNHLLHDRLAIPRDQKIAILAGSVSRWTMADRLVLSACNWPCDWTLVLHCRYGIDAIEPSVLSLVNQLSNRINIVISESHLIEVTELSEVLASVELGLAFYEPTFESQYHGQNLRNIGFSSGKIATYLQHGVPVACNEIGEMAGLVRKFDLGVVVAAPERLPSLLETFTNRHRRENCFNFFEKYLALDQNSKKLLEAIGI